MAEPTLQEIFGVNATQDINSVTISKTDLATVGLTASATNSAESLLLSILLLARNTLTDNNFNNDIDYSIVISNGFSSLTTRGDNTAYRTDQLTVSFSKVDTNSTIDPDDY